MMRKRKHPNKATFGELVESPAVTLGRMNVHFVLDVDKTARGFEFIDLLEGSLKETDEFKEINRKLSENAEDPLCEYLVCKLRNMLEEDRVWKINGQENLLECGDIKAEQMLRLTASRSTKPIIMMAYKTEVEVHKSRRSALTQSLRCSQRARNKRRMPESVTQINTKIPLETVVNARNSLTMFTLTIRHERIRIDKTASIIGNAPQADIQSSQPEVDSEEVSPIKGCKRTPGKPLLSPANEAIPLVDVAAPNVLQGVVIPIESKRAVPSVPPVVAATKTAIPNTPRKIGPSIPHNATPPTAIRTAMTQAFSTARPLSEQQRTPRHSRSPFDLTNLSVTPPVSMPMTSLSSLTTNQLTNAAVQTTPTPKTVLQETISTTQKSSDFPPICDTQRNEVLL